MTIRLMFGFVPAYYCSPDEIDVENERKKMDPKWLKYIMDILLQHNFQNALQSHFSTAFVQRG